jgi:cation:H+ antiporter
MTVVILIASLLIILFGAIVFANGVEWLGTRLKLGHSAVGSVLAAVGTAMPESLIPLVAIFFSKNGHLSDDIGIGAILGAPFMLSTLVFFLCGVSAIIFAKRRRILSASSAGTAFTPAVNTPGPTLTVNVSVMRRDLGFFLAVYSVAFLAAFIHIMTVRYVIAIVLALSYVVYVTYTLRQGRAEFNKGEDEGEDQTPPLYLARNNPNPPTALVLLQVAIGLVLIVVGARIFVDATQSIAIAMGVPALILALLIAPITTELPETFNSFFWISRGKDTLALGNICGAMIIQSSILPAMGIAFTAWNLTPAALVSCLLAIISSAIILFQASTKGSLKPVTLITGGIFYLAFLFMVFTGVIK